MASTDVMQALSIKEMGVGVVGPAPIPKLRPDHVLVKVEAVALNPTDWKHIDAVGVPGTRSGCDFAGTIVELGPDLSRADLKVGDKVAGLAHGANHSDFESGCFAQYVRAKTGLLIRIPPNLTVEQAASLGVGTVTVGQALYQSLGLPLPSAPAKEPFPILIYGGSTATGTLAIQFAKLSGLTVITTCSPRNFDLVKSLGADYVFDYHSPTVGADIKRVTKDKLAYAFDCQSDESSRDIVAEAMGSAGGKYGALLFVKDWPRQDVEMKVTVGYTAIGETFFKWGRTWEGQPDHYEFSSKFAALAQELLAQGKVKPHPVEVRDGGLEGVLEGLDEMRKGKISGKKLVYRI